MIRIEDIQFPPAHVGPRIKVWLAASLLFCESLLAVQARQVSIHDPAMAKEGDTFYLFSTDPGIKFYTSKDMIHWNYRARVFPGEPAWAQGVTTNFNGHIWAPDIEFHAGKYYLYYAVSAPGKNSSAIGVTVNKTLDPDSPGYKWEDHGIVLESIPGRDLWNAIDPNIILDTNGTPWMDFGSFWTGVKLVKLNTNWMELAEPQEWYSIAKRDRSVFDDDRDPGDAEVEGPFIFKKGDYYYLFDSWGLCCRGNDSTYKIMVGRSKDVRGPYLDKTGNSLTVGGGSLVLDGNRSWPGRGGASVYTFDGKDYLVFHAYEAADNGLQKLQIAEIRWDDEGWPMVDEKKLDQYRSVLLNQPAHSQIGLNSHASATQ
jgi:arabinan endo-1,5-alpha-L-arabinosidase